MATESKGKATYVAPRVVLHSRDEILSRAGPAIGCARWGTGAVTAESLRKMTGADKRDGRR